MNLVLNCMSVCVDIAYHSVVSSFKMCKFVLFYCMYKEDNVSSEYVNNNCKLFEKSCNGQEKKKKNTQKGHSATKRTVWSQKKILSQKSWKIYPDLY